jgi:hypothetical protein
MEVRDKIAQSYFCCGGVWSGECDRRGYAERWRSRFAGPPLQILGEAAGA